MTSNSDAVLAALAGRINAADSTVAALALEEGTQRPRSLPPHVGGWRAAGAWRAS